MYSLSRATRRVADLGALLAELDKRGVGLTSLTEGVDGSTPAGRIVLNVLASVAEWERQEIAGRTSAVLRSKRGRLEVYSGEILYGFRRVKDRLEPIPAELEVIAQILDLHRQGGVTLRAIAARLDGAKIPTKKNRPRWSCEVVRQIILREAFYRTKLGMGVSDG